MSKGTSEMMARSAPAQVGGDQGGLARMTAEEFHHADALVGAGGGAELVDEADAAGDGGGETDTVVGAEDVVVHRLGDADDGEAFAMDAGRVSQGVLTADGHQDIYLEVFQHPQDVGGEVHIPVFVHRELLRVQKRGRFIRRHPAGIGAGRVEKRATGPVNGADDTFVQRDHVLRLRGRVIGVIVQQSGPSPADADDLMAFIHGPIDQSLDAGIQSRDVAPSSQNSDSHACSLRTC
jgi:hypothetical protein